MRDIVPVKAGQHKREIASIDRSASETVGHFLALLKEESQNLH